MKIQLTDSEKINKIKEIIAKHEISCGEVIWQRDSISENALSIIEEVCEIVGYTEKEGSEEKEETEES